MSGSRAAVRFHAFDALRAGMMLFGIVMHAGLVYSRMPANPIWAVKDAARTPVADWLFDTSGLFRMPAFFLMAGFFAGLLVTKRGEWRFAVNRVRRLAVPFAVGWVIGFPLLRAAFAVAVKSPVEWDRLFTNPYPIHLWFLEYLLVYCLGGVVVAPLFAPVGPAFRRLLGWGLLPVLGIAATAPILAYSRTGGFGTPLSFTPDAVSLAAYAVFFAVGWGLYANADRLTVLKWAGWPTLALGVLAAYHWGGVGPFGRGGPPMMGPPGGEMPVPKPDFAAGGMPPFPFPGGADGGGMPPFPFLRPGGGAGDGMPPFPIPPGFDPSRMGGPPMMPAGGMPGFGGGSSSGWSARLPQAARTATITWLLTLGLAGVFLLHVNRPVGIVRYFAGASYWLYLAHFPAVAWVGLLLQPLDAPGWAKLSLNVAITVGGLLVPYELARRALARPPALRYPVAPEANPA